MGGVVREAVRTGAILHNLLRTALTIAMARSERPASRTLAPRHSPSRIRHSRRWRDGNVSPMMSDELTSVEGLIAFDDRYAFANTITYAYPWRADV